MPDSPDARTMSDRELLIHTFEVTKEVKALVVDHASRLSVLETKVDERTGPSKKTLAGMGVTGAAVAMVLDYIRAYLSEQD